MPMLWRARRAKQSLPRMKSRRRFAPRNDRMGDVLAMGMTITEKILAVHAGRPEVRPGDLIDFTVDFLFANDITAPLAIKEFEKMGVAQVFDPDRHAIVFDHYVADKDIATARQSKITRDFEARRQLH